jgi:hypothetical protein
MGRSGAPPARQGARTDIQEVRSAHKIMRVRIRRLFLDSHDAGVTL